MKQDEIIFVLDNEEASVPHENEPKPDKDDTEIKDKKRLRNPRKIIFISFLALVVAVAITFIKFSNNFDPVFYFIDESGSLSRITRDGRIEKLLENEYVIYFIKSNPKTGDTYIAASKIDYKSTMSNLFYMDRNSKPVPVMECLVRDIYFAGDKSYLLAQSSNKSGNTLYELEKNNVKQIADGVWHCYFHEDKSFFSFIDTQNKLFVYKQGKLRKIGDEVNNVYYADDSDDIFFTVYSYENTSKYEENLLKYSTKKEAVETVIDKMCLNINISSKGDKVFYQDDAGTLYVYSSKGTQALAEKCYAYGVISDTWEICYIKDNVLYYTNNKNQTVKLYDITSNIVNGYMSQPRYGKITIDTDNKRFYILRDNFLYTGKISPSSDPEIKCLSENASYIISCNEKTSGTAYGYIISTGAVCGFSENRDGYNLFTSVSGNGKIIDYPNIYIATSDYYKDSFLIYGSNIKNDDSYKLYYIKPGRPPKMIDENIEYYTGYGEKPEYIFYIKKSEVNPDKMELYASNGSKTTKITNDYNKKWQMLQLKYGF